MSRVRHLCDTVIRLESFAGSAKEKNPAYKEYHGMLPPGFVLVISDYCCSSMYYSVKLQPMLG